MKNEFLVIYYLADSDNVIKNIGLVEAKDINDAFEETRNNFTSNIIIPKNRNNKEEIIKLLRAFD